MPVSVWGSVRMPAGVHRGPRGGSDGSGAGVTGVVSFPTWVVGLNSSPRRVGSTHHHRAVSPAFDQVSPGILTPLQALRTASVVWASPPKGSVLQAWSPSLYL